MDVLKVAERLLLHWRSHGYIDGRKKFQRSWDLTGKELQHEIRACIGPETVHWGGWRSQPDSERTELQPELHTCSVLWGMEHTDPAHSGWKSKCICRWLEWEGNRSLKLRNKGFATKLAFSVSSHGSPHRNAEGRAGRYFLVSNIMFWFKNPKH